MKKTLRLHRFSISLFALLSLSHFSSPTTTLGAVCTDGFADQFPCLQVDLMSRLDLSSSGIRSRSGNDIWGWTDAEGNEYALMGLSNKTALVDVTNPERPIHIGDLPTHTQGSVWRDVKVFANHAFIVSEAMGHGMQVLDLNAAIERRRSPQEVLVLEEAAHYDLFGSAHNIAINEESGFAYAVGTDNCDFGVHVIDIRVPAQPRFVTCIDREIFEPDFQEDQNNQDLPKSPKGADDGDAYTHDIQCVNYRGPDENYTGREICVASNDDSINIVDVTDKANIRQLSVMKYEGVGFAHQGWLTEDHSVFILGDEIDELQSGDNTKTYIFNVSDLDQIELIAVHVAETAAVDHNLYVKGNFLYQSNYLAGLRIFDLSRVSEGILEEVAFFDTFPESDRAQFDGAWSVFPYFESGNVIISNIDGHLFVVDPQLD